MSSKRTILYSAYTSSSVKFGKPYQKFLMLAGLFLHGGVAIYSCGAPIAVVRSGIARFFWMTIVSLLLHMHGFLWIAALNEVFECLAGLLYFGCRRSALISIIEI
ncbi:hypothetical protein HS088_TW17G00386 [Tripterygium wilfordii]|uniref:Uncharacterized protein n=1 Tax=Tripterygium wilfordii TaxID=458696 RepID=A0A7J7CFE9_TRIWF|nr:hypothetical protein HS088_TW17G00386 [Tripterygium wilfordii]